MPCFLHKWSKWTQGEKVFSYYVKRTGEMINDVHETWQQRVCQRCGKVQEEKV